MTKDDAIIISINLIFIVCVVYGVIYFFLWTQRNVRLYGDFLKKTVSIGNKLNTYKRNWGILVGRITLIRRSF